MHYWRRIDLECYQRIAPSLDHRVKSGPFAGMLFKVTPTWGCITLKLLGVYEYWLHDLLRRLALAKRFHRVIDLGCAEGYYAVGLTRLFKPQVSFAFDLSEASQVQTKALYQMNSLVGTVGGKAGVAELSSCIESGANTLVMADIEGDEANVLDPNLVSGLRQADIICELHESRKCEMQALLQQRFGDTHSSLIITQKDLQATEIPEFRGYSDLDRHLLSCEARPRPMRWLYLSPKGSG
jgi:hypothetical protein